MSLLLFKSFLHLIYPPVCLHCRGGLQNADAIFCEDCLLIMPLIEPGERCPYCFSEAYCSEKKVCEECQKKAPLFNRLGAVFDHTGPPATLIRALKYSKQTHLSKGCAAYMAAQFIRLDWPLPDYIIPMPIAFNHWLTRGFNQSELIAKELSVLLNRPLITPLKRRSGDFSQASLNISQRELLTSHSFYLNDAKQLQDKCLLLIDDVMTTGTTLRKSAHVLLSACPDSLYALTFSKSVKN